MCACMRACMYVYVCVGGRKRELVARVGEWVGKRERDTDLLAVIPM